MNTIIVFQPDDQVSGLLNQHGMDMSGGIRVMSGFQTMVSQMTVNGSLKGPIFGDAHDIYAPIVNFCRATLAAVQDDVVSVQIILMFHQTKALVARNIINACELFERTRVLQDLADKANKHLRVAKVVLLSCESATDLVVQQPVRRGLQGAVTQASDMRNAAKRAFKTKMAPPHPGQGWYHPSIITFSTGNPDRGGATLDPFHLRFQDLDGAFDQNGDWHFNDPANASHSGTPTAGTIYTDTEGSPVTSEAVPAGTDVNLMGFHP